MWAHTFIEKNIKIMQSCKAPGFAHSYACNWYLLLLLHRSHTWEAWRDPHGHLTLHFALLDPLLRGDA